MNVRYYYLRTIGVLFIAHVESALEADSICKNLRRITGQAIGWEITQEEASSMSEISSWYTYYWSMKS